VAPADSSVRFEAAGESQPCRAAVLAAYRERFGIDLGRVRRVAR